MISHPLLLALDGITSSVCGFVAAVGAIALTGTVGWVESGSVALAMSVALPPLGFVLAALGASWVQQRLSPPALEESADRHSRMRSLVHRSAH